MQKACPLGGSGHRARKWKTSALLKYGETPTPAYTVLHLSASYSHSLGRVSYVVRAGVEDMRDKVTG